ncbi:MAG: Gfo/Idh/MocA family oxidoreductase [Bryobacteraceae bacterium]
MTNQPRRDFLKKSTALLSGAAVASTSQASAAPNAIRVGLITDSDVRWGAHLTAYLDGLAKCKGIEEIAIADTTGRNFEKAKAALGSRFREIRTFRDPGEMIDRVKPQLALVAMEPHHTPPAVQVALEKNCHVLTEKPACVRLEDFARLAKLADARKRQLMLALATRLSPYVRKAKELIEGGYLGKLYSAQLHFIADQTRLTSPEYQRSWRSFKNKAGGGHLLWLGIHYIDVVQYMTGAKITQVNAFTRNVGGQPIEVEDAAVVGMQFDNGMVGTLQSGYFLPRGYHTGIRIWGSEGWVHFDPDTPPMQWFSTHAGAPKGIQTLTEGGAFADAYVWCVQSAVNSAQGSEPPMITATEGLQVLRVIYSAYKAAETRTTQTVS